MARKRPLSPSQLDVLDKVKDGWIVVRCDIETTKIRSNRVSVHLTPTSFLFKKDKVVLAHDPTIRSLEKRLLITVTTEISDDVKTAILSMLR